MKTWYAVELNQENADMLRRWLWKNGVSYETSACGTRAVPRTHFEMFMDEETCEICDNFIDEL